MPARTVEWTDPLEIAATGRAQAGVDFLRSMAEGKVPSPPAARLLGFRIVEAAEGRVVFEYEPHESHYNPLGTVHGGVVAAVFDAALGCAVHTRLPVGVGYTTLEVSTSFVRPVLAGTGRLLCSAEALHVGRTMGTSRAELRDAAGKLYAHGTSTCAVLRGP